MLLPVKGEAMSDTTNMTEVDALLNKVRRRLAAGRDGNFVVDLGGPELGYVLYWGRTWTVPPTVVPNEQYFVDEVWPREIGPNEAIVWEPTLYGRVGVIAWNVAEAMERSHRLPVDTIVLVREELNQSSGTEFQVIFSSAPAKEKPC